jgi:hypothetical protein
MNFSNILLILFLLIILIVIFIYVIIFLFKTDKTKTIRERLYETFHHYKKYILTIKMTFYPESDNDDGNITPKGVTKGKYEIDKNNKKISKGDFEILKLPTPPPPPPPSPEKEVFNIGRNIFTYDEADTVCKALGSRLASKQEIEEAYKKGANWCNNGWSADMEALYPIQKEYYKHEMSIGNTQCGKPGVNGGYMPFPDIKLSTNCYGIKPKPDPNRIEYTDGPLNIKSHDLFKEYKEMSKQNQLNILPFNTNYWSKYSEKPSTYINKHYDKVRFKYNILNQLKTKNTINIPPVNIGTIKPPTKSIQAPKEQAPKEQAPKEQAPKILTDVVIDNSPFDKHITEDNKQIFKDEVIIPDSNESILPNNFNDLYLNSSENYSSLKEENAQPYGMNILSNDKWFSNDNINTYGFEKKILNSQSDFNNIIPK